MTTPAQRPVKTMQGVYAFPRAEYDARGGVDLAREAAESRIRRIAREAGHEPEGRVDLNWQEGDPAEIARVREYNLLGEGEILPEPHDLERVWVIAQVKVRLHAARQREVGVFCPTCGQPPTIRGTSLVCLRCD